MTARRIDALAILGLALATAVVCLPLLAHLTNLPPFATDLSKKYALAASNRLTVTRYGQFPFRSPWLSGGYPTFTYPEDVALSPRGVLVFLCGPFAGLKLDYVITIFIAAAFTYLLAHHQMELPVPAALVTAVTFAFGGFSLQRWLQGWLINTRAVAFPVILYLWWRSKRDLRWIVPCGLVMAVWLLDAKYALAVLAWFALMWMLLRLDGPGEGRATDRLCRRRLAAFGLVLTWAVPLAGVKLLPFVPLMRDHIELGGQGASVSGRQVLVWAVVLFVMAVGPAAARLANRRRAWVLTGLLIASALAAVLILAPREDTPAADRWSEFRNVVHGLVWFGRMEPVAGVSVPAPAGLWEEGSPVGWIGLGLALLAVVTRFRRVWRWALLAFIFLWIDLGQAAPVNLMASVRRLPGIHLIRHPREWLNLYLLFCLAVLAGRGALVPAEWLRRRPGRAVPWIAVAAGVVYLAWIAWPRYRYTVAQPLPPLGPEGDYHLVREEGPRPEHLAAALMYRNTGVINWGFDLHDRRVEFVQPRLERVDGPANPDYRGEVFFLSKKSPNRAALTAISPNRIRVTVDVVETPAHLCINQIKDVNWRTSEGALSTKSLTLGVRLTTPGAYEVRLRYVPVLFYWGLGLSVVSLIGGTALILLVARKRRRAGLSQPGTG